MARGMNVYALTSPVAGLQERIPKEFLKDVYSPDSLNVEIYNGTIASRRGLQLEANLPVEADIVKMFLYQPYSGDRVVMVCTREDIFEYNATSKVFRFLTPRYTTGTVDVTNGSTVVTGSGTSWSSNVKAGDYFGVGDDINSITKWYKIASVDSDTQITLETAYEESSQTGVNYVIRQVFTTGEGDVWRVTQFVDDNYGDIVVFTNGRDYPVRYKLSDPSVVRINNAHKCKDLVVFKDRLIAIHTEEGGGWQTQRFRWSAVANCESWDALDFQDLVDTKGYLVCGALSQNADYLVLFKDDSKYLIRWVGGDFVFDNQRIDLVGTLAPNSVINVPRLGFVYFGSDTRIRLYNGMEDVDLGYNVWPDINNTNINVAYKIHSFYVSYKNQVRIFLPIVEDTINTCFVYDVDNKAWLKWQYKKEILSAVEFWNVSTWVWNQPPLANMLWTEWTSRWNSREYLEDSPMTLYGIKGKVVLADRSYSDDDEVYESYFITKRLNFKMPSLYKRLWKIQIWAEALNNNIDVSIRGDDNLYWSQTETIDLNAMDRDIVKTDLIFDENAENFDLRIKGSGYWRVLALLFWYSPSYSVV